MIPDIAGSLLEGSFDLRCRLDQALKRYRQNKLEGSLKRSNSRPEQIKIEAAYLLLSVVPEKYFSTI